MSSPEFDELEESNRLLSAALDWQNPVMENVGRVLDNTTAHFNGADVVFDGDFKATAAAGLLRAVDLSKGSMEGHGTTLGILANQLNISAKYGFLVGIDQAQFYGAGWTVRAVSSEYWREEFADRLSTTRSALKEIMNSMETFSPYSRSDPNSDIAKWQNIYDYVNGEIYRQSVHGIVNFIPPYNPPKK